MKRVFALLVLLVATGVAFVNFSAFLILLGTAAMTGYTYAVMRFGFPSVMERDKAEVEAKIEVIKSSGELLAETRCGGSIGNMWLSWPLLHVSIFPCGIVVEPSSMPAMAMQSTEIKSLEYKKSFLQGQYIQLDLVKRYQIPWRLYLHPQHPAVEAIEVITGMEVLDANSNLAPEMRLVRDAPLPIRLLIYVGLMANLIVFLAGMYWVTPHIGLIGVVWTTASLFILVHNLGKYLIQGVI